MESDFVDAASTCQEPVKLNMALKLPSGVDPDIPDWLLKYSAIWNFDSNSLSETTNWSYQPKKNQNYPQELICRQGVHSWCKKDEKWSMLYALRVRNRQFLSGLIRHIGHCASCKGKRFPRFKELALGELFIRSIWGKWLYFSSIFVLIFRTDCYIIFWSNSCYFYNDLIESLCQPPHENTNRKPIEG